MKQKKQVKVLVFLLFPHCYFGIFHIIKMVSNSHIFFLFLLFSFMIKVGFEMSFCVARDKVHVFVKEKTNIFLWN